MKKVNSKYSKDSELIECVNSAYNDLQILLQGAFTNISKIPNQLTFTEFNALFESYDWQDIFNVLEELENLPDLTIIESVNFALKESLKADNGIKPISDPRENTYYKVWAGLISESDF